MTRDHVEYEKDLQEVYMMNFALRSVLYVILLETYTTQYSDLFEHFQMFSQNIPN